MNNSTFQQARLKLTAWYLLIIIAISLLFSSAIFFNVSRQIERFIRIQNDRLHQFQVKPFINNDQKFTPPPLISVEELETQKRQLLYSLVLINLCIYGVSGGLGYLLADTTLKPIQIMMDEQNQFISNASHELRTPITTLQAEMEGQLLEANITDAAARKRITSNLEEIDELKKLTNRLLESAMISDPHYTLKHSPVSIKSCLESAWQKLALKAQKKGCRLTMKVPEVKVNGDQATLTDLFVIIFDNAIKYSQTHGAISVSGKKYSQTITIKTIDQGIGIDSSDLGHIFERFYRADKSRSKAEGFGLGLSIAKGIVTKHQGTIIIDSVLNQGTTVTITLPTIA